MRTVSIGSVVFEVEDTHAWYWDRVARGGWENETFRVLDEYVDSATTVIDVGAWIGPISLYASAYARKVIALEPDPMAFAQLLANLQLNPGNRVEAINAAIAHREGSIRLGIRDKPGDSTSSILLGGGGEGWDVRTTTFDALLAAADKSSKLFVKIDIEGYEFELMDRIIHLVTNNHAIVFLSLHPHYFELSAGAAVSVKSPWSKLWRSIRKRSLGRYRALKAVRILKSQLDAHVRIADESGRAISTTLWMAKVLTGSNVTTTGAVLLLPK